MKRVAPLLALLAAGALLLPGCASMLERSYVSSAAHVDYAVTEDESILRAETYQSLVNSILYFVNSHSASGSIRLYNYNGDVEADLASACEEVRAQDPLGSYAVSELSCEFTRILSYYEVDVHVSYSRSAQEVDAIRQVSGLSGLRRELARAIADRESVTVRAAAFSGDGALVEQLFWQLYYSMPQSVLTAPDFSVTLYPEEGTQRIIEISPAWKDSSSWLADYAAQLEQTAGPLLDLHPPRDGEYTVAELAAIVRGTFYEADAAGEGTSEEGDPAGLETPEPPPEPAEPAQTALAALSGEPSTDLGLLLGMEYLCHQVGTEAGMVLGSGPDGRSAAWLIVSTPAGYRHFLPAALRPEPAGEGGEEAEETQPEIPEVPLYTDEELTALGYVWPTDLHPACAGPAQETGTKVLGLWE